MAVVQRLRIAPVKGLGTVTPDRVHVGRGGVAEDRRVFLVDERGAVVTVRSHPRLLTVEPHLDLRRGVLRVLLPDGTSAVSQLDGGGDLVQSRLFGKPRQGRLIGGDAAAALCEVAGERLGVVLAESAGVGWDDGPVSILGRASAEAVGGPGADMARYRMLVELDGTRPYEEDGWVGRTVRLDAATVRVTHQLERCVVVNHSPRTGERDWDGLRALAARPRPAPTCLGVIAEVLDPGDVRVGSPAEVAG